MRIGAFVSTLFASTLVLVGFGFCEVNAGTLAPEASYAALGSQTSVPYGWVDFCQREPQECNQPILHAVDINLTPETWQILNKVNRLVNQTIIPVSNFDHWGTMLDHWDYPKDGKGDCKIYALWKRKLLIDAGFPRQALLMTIVRDENGEGHTILTAKTNRGEFILDNMREDIRSWDATGYHFYKRQSQENPNIWLAIVDSEPKVSSLP
ncbi:MAG: transglutaminase-like cysteine peptidase [Methylovirgula sp.]|jgi:predicted transglutaminase-like cysteine proteinase